MKQAALDQFRTRAQAAAESAHPGTVTYEGADYAAGVVRGPVTVEIDHGPHVLKGMTASISKSVLEAAPVVGKTIIEGGETFKIFEVGSNSARWLVRSATFPSKR